MSSPGILGGVPTARIDPALLLPVQANVRALIDREQLTVNGWARKYGLTQTTVDRIAKGKLDPTTRQVQKIADALGLQAWQLLVPNVDPTNPPRIHGMTDGERRLYERIRESIQELADLRAKATSPGALYEE